MLLPVPAFPVLRGSRRNRSASAFAVPGIFLLLLAACISFPAKASADGIGGLVELTYSHGKTTFDGAGESVTTKGDTFVQRYRLSLDRTLYPNLVFSAGGLYEHVKTWGSVESDTIDEETTASATKIMPTVGLKLNTPFLSAGVDYSRLEQRAKSDGQSAPTTIRESYSANFGLRPEGLPTVNSVFSRQYNYDEERRITDRVEDSAILSLRYQPWRELDLSYSGVYSESTDHLTDLQTQTWTHSGKVSYAKEFFHRVSLSTSYTGTYTETEIIHAGKGLINVPVPAPIDGLFALNDTPLLGQLGTGFFLLINGTLTNENSIDIGAAVPAGEDEKRNVGLQLIDSLGRNTLHVWVDTPTHDHLPSGVAGQFKWEVYTSPDNNSASIWTPHPVSSVQFDTFDNRFEISFPTVPTPGYIKVVVKPLPFGFSSPGFDPSHIYITELQAFLNVPAADVKTKSSFNSHLYSLDVRTLILDRPTLVHNLSYVRSWGSIGEPTWVLSNALSLAHRFSRVFSGSARAGVDMSSGASGDTTSYVYGASLTAVPLETLGHTLSVGGRIDETEDERRTSNSIFLTNWAELYRGINVSLSGGLSRTDIDTGEKTDSATAAAGLTLIPRNNLSIDASYSVTKAEKTGGPTPDADTTDRALTVSASYQPFDAVYLSASISHSEKSDTEPSTFQSYFISWSPLRGGALQLFITYNEERNSTNNGKITTFGPSARWNITPRTSLDVGYGVTKQRSDTGGEGVLGGQTLRERSEFVNVTFRTIF